MGAQLNPTSIAVVAALDYPSATKWMWQKADLAQQYYLQLHTMGGGGLTGHKTHCGLNGTPGKVRVGGLVHLHAASRHRAHHSTFQHAPCP